MIPNFVHRKIKGWESCSLTVLSVGKEIIFKGLKFIRPDLRVWNLFDEVLKTCQLDIKPSLRGVKCNLKF